MTVSRRVQRYSTEQQPWWANDMLMFLLAMASFLIIIFDFEQAAVQERGGAPWVGTSLWWGLAVIDLILAILFGMDLLEDRSRAIDKSWWWRAHGWEFLGLVPMIVAIILPYAGLVRFLRIIRAFSGVFRLVGASSRAQKVSLQRQVANLAFIVIVLIVSGAFTVYVFESARYMEMGCDAAGVVPSDCSGTISQLPEAIWWALVTTTTVGYGDFRPITAAGRVVAGFLMMIGIGLVGTLAATMSQLFYEVRIGNLEDHEHGGSLLLERLDRIEALHASGSIDDETHQDLLDLFRKRIHSEMHMLELQIKETQGLPMPIMTAMRIQAEERFNRFDEDLAHLTSYERSSIMTRADSSEE